MEPITRTTLIKGLASFIAMTMNKFVVTDVHSLCDDFGSTIFVKTMVIFFIFYNGAQNLQTAAILTSGALVWLSVLRSRKESQTCENENRGH